MKSKIIIPKNANEDLRNLGLNVRDVVVYVTSNCNLRCKHCYIGNSLLNEANEIDIGSLKMFLSSYSELDRITLLGGEFFLYKKSIELMKFVSSQNILEKRITTNLNYLVPGLSDIAKNGNIRMCVSLDGHNQELHEKIRGVKTFDITIDNLLTLIKDGVDIEITHTINSVNYDYVFDLIEFLRDIGIKRLNLHKISLKGNALEHRYLNISPTMWRKLTEKLEAISSNLQKQPITVRYEVGYATIKEFELLKQNNYQLHSLGSFYSHNGHRVVIYPDGKVYISSEAFDTESFIGSFDNAKFITNLSDVSELKLSHFNNFDVSLLNPHLQGDANFPIALSVSFRQSLIR
jgi:MoaA/NifB/PqqE/SkfB family radical SAM enzyme